MFRTLPPFEFFSPHKMKDALSLLSKHGPKLKIIAGGTDLISQMRWRELRPEYILSLVEVNGLAEIQYDEKSGLRLGALCKIGTIAKSEIIKEKYPILAKAASVLASAEIRNRATVGGNLCTAAPSADMPPSLLVLDAKVVIASEKGERVIPIEDFFLGPKKNVLKHDEVLVRLEIPPMKPDSAGEYIKFGRRNAMEIALIGAAARITLKPGSSTCEEARLAFATAAPTPIRTKGAEKLMIGKNLDNEVIELAGKTASKEASPRTSWRSTEEYRRQLIHVLTCRVIRQALDKL